MDEDFALALHLQFQEELSNQSAKRNTPSKAVRPKSSSIVDDSWEYIDPSPDIHSLFIEFNKLYFWGKLEGVEVKWSSRMTLCAGLCCYEGRGGLCSVRLSQPLLKYRPRRDLVQTLLHEMIHAFLFVTHNNKDHSDHGPEFCRHMHRINNETGANITVYHNFHDEVNLYRQHWWKCNGPCQRRPPYFGLVRRATNRCPGPSDSWWNEHQQKCGGTFIKIKEPENYKPSKNSKLARSKSEESVKAGASSSVLPFSGAGHVLGTLSSNRPKATDKAKNTDSRSHLTQRNLGDYFTSPSVTRPTSQVPSSPNSFLPPINRNKTVLNTNQNDSRRTSVTLPNIFQNSVGQSSRDSLKRTNSTNSESNPKVFKNKNVNNNRVLERTRDDITVMPSVAGSLYSCPVCSLQFPENEMNAHLDECLDLGNDF